MSLCPRCVDNRCICDVRRYHDAPELSRTDQHQAHLMRARTFIRPCTDGFKAGFTSKRSTLTPQRSCVAPRMRHLPRSLRFASCTCNACNMRSAFLLSVDQSAYNLRWATLPLLKMVNSSIHRPGLLRPMDRVSLLVST